MELPLPANSGSGPIVQRHKDVTTKSAALRGRNWGAKPDDEFLVGIGVNGSIRKSSPLTAAGLCDASTSLAPPDTIYRVRCGRGASVVSPRLVSGVQITLLMPVGGLLGEYKYVSGSCGWLRCLLPVDEI